MGDETRTDEGRCARGERSEEEGAEEWAWRVHDVARGPNGPQKQDAENGDVAVKNWKCE